MPKKLMSINIPNTSSWGNLVKYVRSPLGFFLSLVIICAGIVLASLCADFPRQDKYIILGIFFVAVIFLVIIVIKRIPKTPQGLVATEDYYALERYLEYSKIYGSERHPKTRKQALVEKTITGDIALGATNQPKLPSVENH